ncbi:MAG: hypothetical protein ACJAXV_001209 [Bacteroidia bacterium]|jgi:hypothetical protein
MIDVVVEEMTDVAEVEITEAIIEIVLTIEIEITNQLQTLTMT